MFCPRRFNLSNKIHPADLRDLSPLLFLRGQGADEGQGLVVTVPLAPKPLLGPLQLTAAQETKQLVDWLWNRNVLLCFPSSSFPFFFSLKVVMDLKPGLSKAVPCDLVIPASFLKSHFLHTWPVLPVHLRFNQKSFSFIPNSAILS